MKSLQTTLLVISALTLISYSACSSTDTGANEDEQTQTSDGSDASDVSDSDSADGSGSGSDIEPSDPSASGDVGDGNLQPPDDILDDSSSTSEPTNTNAGSEGNGGDGAALRPVIVEVDYVNGAEPYVGISPIAGGDLWSLLEENMKGILSEERDYTIPKNLDEMDNIAISVTGPFNSAEILTIAEQSRQVAQTSSDVISYYIVYLDGYFERHNGEEARGVIGVSIGDTGVIAMFKPVIESMSLLSDVRKFSEQAVLVHEIGHAAGLVNNGFPLVSAHQDEENGRHCDNNDCVMYWANEGTVELANFASTQIANGNRIMFDQNCIDDAVAGATP